MWYEKPLRIAALQCESEGDSNRVVDVWNNMGFNVEQLLHISADGYVGYFREDKIEKIKNYLSKATEKGLKLIFYLGMRGPENLAEANKWQFILKTGEPIDPSLCWSLCINSPFRDWYKEQIKQLAQLDIDGIFIDGPFFPQDSCYCEYCQAKFKKRYGVEIPTVENPADKTWRDFIEFRYDSVAEFMRDAAEALKSVKPEAIIYSNGMPLGSGATSGRNNRRSVQYQDMLGAEGGFVFYGKPDSVPFWKPGVLAKLLETQAQGKPTITFIAGDHKAWHRYLHTPSEIKLLIADAVANGSSPWYGIHSPIEDLQGPSGIAAGEIMRFLRDNEDYYCKTKSMADVAILWSARTSDYYGAESEQTDFNALSEAKAEKSSYYDCYHGFCEMLLRLHIPYDVLDEEALLENSLNKYKVVVMPNAAYLSENEINAVKNFVKNGGNIISSLETSIYGIDAVKHPEFSLAEVFGISRREKTYDFRVASYMSITEMHEIFLDIFPQILPAQTIGLEVDTTTGVPLAFFREAVHYQYKPLPPLTTPAIVMNQFGKGKSVYFAGNFGESYRGYGIIDHLRILGNAINWLRKPQVKVSGLPQTVEVVLRSQKENKKLMVHLVNFTGAMRRPISSVVQIDNGKLEIAKETLSQAGITNTAHVKALVSGKEIMPEICEDSISIALPSILEYEVIAICG